MTYKTISVCITDIERRQGIINAAVQLALQFQAHVNGLYVIPGAEVYAMSAYSAGAGIDDTNQKYFLGKLSEVQADFERAMTANGLAFSFQSIDALSPMVAQEAVKHCRAADLILVTALDPARNIGVESDFVERLVIAAGRPVLIIPHKVGSSMQCDDVILAWDQSREAHRAAFDALPLIKKAKNVHVVTVDPPLHGEVAGASIAEALSRHEVSIQTVSVSSDGLGIGETLIRAANDKGAGLIVMGAYGHSRFAEFIFGGATRSIIHGVDRPVLMSH